MTYVLGQPVNVTGTAVKNKSYGRVSYVNGPLPVRRNYDNPKSYDKGFIVGSRHVTEGHIDSWEDGRTYVPSTGTARRVWLVAFDLHMKPAMCFDHQVAPIEEESWATATVHKPSTTTTTSSTESAPSADRSTSQP